ncbi:hypothetical protein E4U44_007429 [Claviceps purpurea]|nr:hypothetical protein E4U44_007429 [Claviceps purpurea]
MERPGAKESTNPLKKLPRHKRHRIASQVQTGRTFSTNEIHADLDSVRKYGTSNWGQDEGKPIAKPKTANKRRCTNRDTDWVRLLKDGRKLAIHGTDGSVLPMLYQGLIGSLHKAIVLGSDQVWIISSDVKEKATRSPDGFTYFVYKAGTSNGFEALPTPRVILALGSTLMHNGTIATHNATAKFIGEPFGLPSQLDEMGVAMFPWDGKLESGSYAPKGRYRFVVRALRGYLAMPPSTCTVRQGLQS